MREVRMLFDMAMCPVCGAVCGAVDIRALKARCMERLGNDPMRFWQALSVGAALVLDARVRMAEALGCSDQEYAFRLADLELTLEMALSDCSDGEGDSEISEQVEVPELALLGLILAATRRMQCGSDRFEVGRDRGTLEDALRAVRRVSLPWAEHVASARQQAVMFPLQARPGEGVRHG